MRFRGTRFRYRFALACGAPERVARRLAADPLAFEAARKLRRLLDGGREPFTVVTYMTPYEALSAVVRFGTREADAAEPLHYGNLIDDAGTRFLAFTNAMSERGPCTETFSVAMLLVMGVLRLLIHFPGLHEIQWDRSNEGDFH